MIPKALLSFWFLICIPLLCGGLFLPLFPEKKKTVPALYMSGFLLQFALFELIALPCVISERAGIFYTCSNLFALLVHLAAAGGAYQFLRAFRQGLRLRPLQKPALPVLLCTGLYAALLLFRMYMAFTRASFDGDDAYYVAHAVTAAEQGWMYRLDAYQGGLAPIDIRHALAVLPMWEAHVARMSMLHVTVFVHTLLPLFLIPLTDLAWYLCGRYLLRDKKAGALPLFLSLMALFQIFGSVSIYTAERFALTRTWQGKSLMANLVVPLLFWLFLWLFDDADAKKEGHAAGRREAAAPYVLLALVNLFAGVCTSMGVVMAGGLTLFAGLFYVLYCRAPKRYLYLLPAVLVNTGYLLLYFLKG
ncbi:MAG: hypothetical protein IJP92_05875 [Lachnospiraceae bacterium]|nr:hypothetical protein [Lachnospiraceae bacterium]